MTTIAAMLRAACAAALISATAAMPAGAQSEEEELIDRVSDYLNSVTTISGEFRQIEEDTVFTDGEYAIWRPGRIFLRYEPPNPVRLVSDGIWVAIFDEEDDPAIDRYPLIDTPLYLLLKEDVDLRDEGAVRYVSEDDDFYRFEIVDPSGDVDGHIELVFDKDPLRLREWTVIEADGYRTRVVLRTAAFNTDLEPSLFVVPNRTTEEQIDR